MDLSFSTVSILEYILNWWHALSELWEAKFLKFSTGNVDVEVLTLSKSFAVNF